MVQPGNFFVNDRNFSCCQIKRKELRRQVGIEDSVKVIALARILVQDFVAARAECAREKRAVSVNRAYSAGRTSG